MNILVIGGGTSSERPVSLRSAQAVYDALETNSLNIVDIYDWDGTEEWLNREVKKYDVVFPVLHGEGGEDGKIQRILERNKVAFVGTDSLRSAECIDKTATKNILRKHGIRVPKGQVVTYQQYIAHDLYNKAHVLKPVIGGSSIDTFIFPELRSRVDADIKKAFDVHHTLLVEEYITGIEITVPILVDKKLPIIEIIPPKNATFDYANKYNGKTQELCPAVHLSKDQQNEAYEIAKSVHSVMGCRHLSRTDMIVQNNEIVVLEINTMPGFTSQSLFPRAAAVFGFNMQDLTMYLVQLAYEGSNE